MAVDQRIIAAIKREASRFYTDSCDIAVEVEGRDEFGGVTYILTNVVREVPCRLISLGMRAAAIDTTAGQETMKNAYRLIVPVGTPLGVNQTVTIAATAQDPARQFSVVSVEDALTDKVFAAAVLFGVEV